MSATTSSTSSTSSLLMSSQTRHTTPKDYEASFGKLSSQYGFGGSVPSLPRKTTKSTKSTKSSSQTPKSLPSQSSVTQPRAQKDYESSFGQLSSSYGYGGGPGFSLPTRQ